MKKFSLIIGLASLVVLVGLSAASCQRAKTPDTTSTDQTATGTDTNQTTTGDTTTGGLDGINLPPTGSSTAGNTTSTAPFAGLADPAAAQTAMTKELADATTAIQSLQPDAVLQLVSMKFVNSLSDQAGLTTNYYIFSSPSDTRYYYLVNMPHNGESMKRFLMPKEDLDLPFDLIAVQQQYWKLSYVDALRAVETQGASDFRTKHSTFEVSAILAKPAGQFLNWFITYRATDSTGAVFQASVDSTAGTVKVAS